MAMVPLWLGMLLGIPSFFVAIFGGTQPLDIHRGADRHAELRFGDAVFGEKFFLAVRRSAAVTAHRGMMNGSALAALSWSSTVATML